jgi:3-oxoacyl-[acyl-carrier protein] reductase
VASRRPELDTAYPAASYDFNGRVALVTGGAGDIGAAVARRLLGHGARVAALDLRAADVDGVLSLTGDVSRSGDVETAVARVESELGGLHVLVCAAGVSGDSLRTTDVSDGEWSRVFSINCDGVFFANRAAARVMVPRAYGRIVNVASIAGKEGNPMAAAYSASKAAVIGMTKSIGKDLAETGVLVNCVAPAVIQTRMLGDMSEEHVAYMIERIPMRRMGRPEEVAGLIAFLASEECSFSTGAVFDLSGGRATF